MGVYEIIKELESTSSRNKKIEILKRNKDNQILKETLFYTYNPFMEYYVLKLPTLQVGDANYEDRFADFKTLLEKLNARELTGGKAIGELVKLLESLNERGQYVATQVIKRKFAKAGINVKTVNKVFKDLIPEFNVQLANTYDLNKQHKYSDMFIASTKLDGIRAIYFKDKGLYTRKGKKIENLPHIVELCQEACEIGNMEFIDGELWTDEFDFNTIQSAVMSNKQIKEDLANKIVYNAFACNFSENDSESMMKYLETVINDIKDEHITVVWWTKVANDPTKIADLTIQSLKAGFEGIMLRNMYKPYSWKRDDNLLKVKSFQLLEMKSYLPPRLQKAVEEIVSCLRLDDFKIVDAIEGTGNFKGMLGALLVEGEVNGRKITSKVGTGFTVEQRIDYWKNRDNLIGKEVVIVCQEITKDNSLRFPVIEAIKLDR